MPIYMKVDGIKGQVVATGYEDQISLESCQWGVARSVSSFTGTSREVSSPMLAEFVCSKVLDSSSQAIARNATFGDPLPSLEIAFVRDAGGGSLESYLTYTLENVLITNYSISGASGLDAPMESFSLNALIVKAHQTWRGGDYGQGGEDDYSYSIATKASV
jgi:type VI secretion system secreted protein Hcp